MGSNQLSEEILSVSFSDSFGLVVEDVGEVVMILLLGSSDFDKGNDKHSRSEEHSGSAGDASDALKRLSVLELDLFEVDADWVEAVVNVIGVSVAA